MDLDYLIEPKFGNINKLFVHSFKNGDDNPTGNSFDEYYMPLVEIKDFNGSISHFLISQERMKNLLKSQEMMTIQQEIY